MWDERYAGEAYVYGTEPNDFLKENVSLLKKGKVLSLGEGEGRNAVFLTRQGFEVTALDASRVGLAKTQQLACKSAHWVATINTDLNDYEFEEEQWDSIISIFCHLPPALRRKVHQGIIKSLKPDGTFLLEAYTPQQLEFKTGGPPEAELMLTADQLAADFADLQIIVNEEKIRTVTEGKHHNGQSAVVQFIAQKTKDL